MSEVGINVQESTKLKHSKLGLASFIISLMEWILLIIPAIIYPIISKSNRQMVINIITITIFFNSFLILAGIGLGIAGLCQKNRKKTFAIFGLILLGILFILFIVNSMFN